MHLDLTDLRLFLNVHAAGTITAGAAATHMTLASASERIRGMEDTVGAPLLLRDRRGVRLAPAGQALVHHARLVLQQVEQMQGELGAYGAGIAGHVRLLCNTSALSEHLPELLAGFLAAHPRIAVDLEERASHQIVDALRSNLADIGIVSDAADLEGLCVLPFRPDPLVLVVPRGHALAARASVTLAEVIDQPFVGLAEGSALHAHVAQQARRLGRQPDYRVRLRGFEAVCRMVGAGIGIAIVPQKAAARLARSSRVHRVALGDAWARRALVLCVRQPEALAAPAALLLAQLRGAGVHGGVDPAAGAAVPAVPGAPRRPR
ncbi:MAG: LysR substrate-binding domain-containing protein [Pseudomonadota bacterium]